MMLMSRKNHNAEGYCRICGCQLGISGHCAVCALQEMDRKNQEFMQSRTLSWWRDYWRGAVEVLEEQLERRATMSEKLTMLKRLKWNIHTTGAPSSFTALALVTLALDLEAQS